MFSSTFLRQKNADIKKKIKSPLILLIDYVNNNLGEMTFKS